MNKYAFIYPGQGSQSLKMGYEFIKDFHIAKEFLNRSSEALKIDFNNLLNENEELLNQTQYTQPAIFLVSAIAQAIFQNESDTKPYIAFGHSLGEVSAYCLNGGASLEEGIILTHTRGKLMSEACQKIPKDNEPGMLVVLGSNEETVKNICDDCLAQGKKVWVANLNLDNQTVLAGLKKDLEEAGEILKGKGAKRVMFLKMSVASHCPLLQSALEPFQELLRSSIKDCLVDIISNASLDIYKKREDALNNLALQLTSPVQYHASVKKAVSLGVTHFIELGNGNILEGLNKKITDIPTISINNTDCLKKISQLE